MSLYLIEVAYTGESWKTQVHNREDPRKRIQGMVDKLGGHIVGLFYAFGDYDVVGLSEMPSPEAAAAFALAVGAGGSVKTIKTTPLMTIEQGLESMKMAAEVGTLYHAPVPQEAAAAR